MCANSSTNNKIFLFFSLFFFIFLYLYHVSCVICHISFIIYVTCIASFLSYVSKGCVYVEVIAEEDLWKIIEENNWRKKIKESEWKLITSLLRFLSRIVKFIFLIATTAFIKLLNLNWETFDNHWVGTISPSS